MAKHPAAESVPPSEKSRLRLIVMRHAKSSWDNESLTDHQRPLNDRGRSDAPKVGTRLVELGWQPELVLSSDARRTRETFEALCRSFRGPVEGDFRRQLYQAGADDVISVVSAVSPHIRTVMLLGHNPGWEHVVQYLTGEPVAMKTATAALLQIDRDDWQQAMHCPNQWELVDIIHPRDL
jgi:phosphohistidine phosphatase